MIYKIDLTNNQYELNLEKPRFVGIPTFDTFKKLLYYYLFCRRIINIIKKKKSRKFSHLKISF